MGTARSTVALASSLFVAVALAGSLLVTVGLFIAIGLLFAARFISLAVGLTVCLAIRLAVFALAVGAFAGLTIGFAILTLAVGTLALFFAALCLSLVAVGRLDNSRCGNYRSGGNTGQKKKFLQETENHHADSENHDAWVLTDGTPGFNFATRPEYC